MTKKLPYEDGYDFDDEDYSDTRPTVRRLKKEQDAPPKKKKWDRETFYDRNNDYDDRR